MKSKNKIFGVDSMGKRKLLLFSFFICLLFALINIFMNLSRKNTENDFDNELMLNYYTPKASGIIQDIDEINKTILVMVDPKQDAPFDQEEQSLYCDGSINLEFLKVGDTISFRYTNYDQDENIVFVSSIDLPGDMKNLINCPAVEALITSIESDRIIVQENSGRTEEVTISEDELNGLLDIENFSVGDRIKVFHNGQILKGKYGSIIEILILEQ